MAPRRFSETILISRYFSSIMPNQNALHIFPLRRTKECDFLTIEKFYNIHFTRSPWQEGALRRFLSATHRSPRGFVAIDSDNVAGLILGRKTERSPLIYNLTSILVHPDYRKSGLSSLLLKKFLLSAKRVSGIRKVNLHFRASNNLEGFYARFGFKLIQTNETYSDGEKKALMEKKVTSRPDLR